MLNQVMEFLTRSSPTLEAARSQYKAGDDVDPVFNAQMGIVRDRLAGTAAYAALLATGSFSANQRKAEFDEILDQLGLMQWFPRWALELDKLWGRRKHWESLDEFYALNFHVERMLWQMKTVVWPLEDGRTYVCFL